MFSQTLLVKKMLKSKTILFLDFDGTIFTPDAHIITAPRYNLQIKSLLDREHIPFVIVTGRSDWNFRSEIELALLGLPKPDAIIAGAGTIIYYRLENGQLGLDTSWQNMMQSCSIQWKNVKKILWNQETILQIIHPLLPASISIRPKTHDRHLIRLYAKEIAIKVLLQMKKNLEDHFTNGLKILFTEKLLQKNSLEIFSGDIILVPATAGKENAVTYILKNLHSDSKPTINVLCFGDATIDIDMLTLKSKPNQFTIQTYGVNLQPLAKKL